MNKSICVYSSSSTDLDEEYYDIAEKVGIKIAERGDSLVFGAGAKGLMGATARGVKMLGGRVIGVIPERLNERGIVFERCDEIYVTPEMRSRKKLLDEKSDAFITLPGSFGTLEEVIEIITSKQLGYHKKPIVIFNYKGYYDYLLKQFEVFFVKRFAKESYSTLYFVTDNVDAIFEYIDNYIAQEVEVKYF